jgi:ubiquinone/menaquinone biosynthesis C-methylase UbiE
MTVLEPDGPARNRGQRGHPRFRFVDGRGEHLPFPDTSFDAVTAIRSTHHMESPELFLRETYRVLAPNGVLIIEEMNRAPPWAKLFAGVAHRRHHEKLDFRGVADWSEALRSAGFEQVRASDGPRWFFVVGTRDPSH